MNSAKALLEQYWHTTHFRSEQEAIVNTLISGDSCVVLMPTGGGKSLCYQLPALLKDGLCLVITPLISLMQDQVAQLLHKDIPAAYLSQHQTEDEKRQIIKSAIHGKLKLLYISPERLHSNVFLDALSEMDINLIAVDEAHCISQWGHDFRPDYLKINTIFEVLPKTPLIALTASATPTVLADIQQQLTLEHKPVFRSSFGRPNIHISTVNLEHKHQYLIQYFTRVPKQCAIVYCKSRKRTQELALLLQQNGIEAAAYHAGLEKDQRAEIQNKWMRDETTVIVATNAFGMGIDKANVRHVIHFDPTNNLEAYYQEIGRAGRDGLPAQAICLYHTTDIIQLEGSTALHYPDEAYLRYVYKSLCNFLQLPTGVALDDYYTFDLNTFFINFKLNATLASNALKLLAQEGLWSISERVFHPEKAIVYASRNDIEALEKQHPIYADILIMLLRLYSGIYYDYTRINAFQIAKFLNLKKADVIKGLHHLTQLHLIHYTPAEEQPEIHIHHYRVPSEHLILNQKRINTLKRNHEQRIKRTVHFLTTANCLHNELLDYFGEAPSKPCLNCSNCQKNLVATSNQSVKESILIYLKKNGTTNVKDLLAFLSISPDLYLQTIRNLIDTNDIAWTQDDAIMLNSKRC